MRQILVKLQGNQQRSHQESPLFGKSSLVAFQKQETKSLKSLVYMNKVSTLILIHYTLSQSIWTIVCSKTVILEVYTKMSTI